MSEKPAEKASPDDPSDPLTEERSREDDDDRGAIADEGEGEGAELDNDAAQDPAEEAPEPPSDAAPGKPLLSKRAALLLGLVLPGALLFANMWRVRTFTIDDAYISYRYARNLARGMGLVYNAGERIEGYTNFLWTVLLAGAIRVGIDPDVFAKVMGGLSAFGALGITYALSARLKPFHTLPCVATWLLASTIVFTGYAVFGLETIFFVFLLLTGTYLFFRETDAPAGADAPPEKGALLRTFPFSGLVFALAGLTRPEAPMFIGILMLFLGRRFFARQNLLRGALFAAPIAAHLLWRRSYYGEWVPNTLAAKTGNLSNQVKAGWGYFQGYAEHAGPVLYLAIFGVALAFVARRRDVLALATVAAAVVGYVILVGGDWMPRYRFVGTFEPFAFLLVDLAARDIADRKSRVARLALAGFALATIVHRTGALKEARATFTWEERFWTSAAGGISKWLVENTKPGELVVGDIGYIGYATDYPILDALGLIDPVISKLPGGYTHKVGPGFADHIFTKAPAYILIIAANAGCDQPTVIGSQVLFRDKRFKPSYAVAGKVQTSAGVYWCIYQRNEDSAPR